MTPSISGTASEPLFHAYSQADGRDIPGKQMQRATASLKAALGLDPERPSTAEEVSHSIAGRRADGAVVEGAGTQTARSRSLHLVGVSANKPDTTQADHFLVGRMADGRAINLQTYADGQPTQTG